MNKLFKFTWMLALASLTLFTSCEKDDVNVTENVEFFVNSAVFDMEERGNCGQFGCYEFVFPISIQFADGSSVEVADYEALRATIKDWKEANPEAEERPTLAYPLEVMDEEGGIISVASKEELVQLGRKCRRDFFKRKRHQRGKHRGELCFRPSFPVTLNLPDGSTITGADAKDLKEQVRAWRAANPDSEERPTLAFPTNIMYKDGTIVSVASIEELKELKAACADDEEG